LDGKGTKRRLRRFSRDHLGLLLAMFGEVLIPPAVLTELEQPRSRFPSLSIRDLPFVRVETPMNRAVVDELLVELDPGEAEALALAVEVHADAILIDEVVSPEFCTITEVPSQAPVE
jgi:predicted nucleic acid-binding protein